MAAGGGDGSGGGALKSARLLAELAAAARRGGRPEPGAAAALAEHALAELREASGELAAARFAADLLRRMQRLVDRRVPRCSASTRHAGRAGPLPRRSSRSRASKLTQRPCAVARARSADPSDKLAAVYAVDALVDVPVRVARRGVRLPTRADVACVACAAGRARHQVVSPGRSAACGAGARGGAPAG